MIWLLVGLILGCLATSLAFLLWRRHERADAALKPSPLQHLEYRTAEQLFGHPEDVVVYRVRVDAEHETIIRAPGFSASMDKFQMVAEFCDNTDKALTGTPLTLTVDLTTQLVHIDGGPTIAMGAKHLKSTHLKLVTTIGKNGFDELWQRLPDILDRLPQVVMGGLLPLARYLSGLENSRLLRENNKNLQILLAGRRNDPKAKLERVWLRANQITRFPDEPYAKQTLIGYRDELLELRLVWEGEILDLFQTSREVVRAWRQGGRKSQLERHILPVVEKTHCLQLALFAEYCISIATDTREGFVGVIIPQEMYKVKDLVDAFDEQKYVLRDLETYREIVLIGKTLNAYYGFLSQLPGRLNETSPWPQRDS